MARHVTGRDRADAMRDCSAFEAVGGVIAGFAAALGFGLRPPDGLVRLRLSFDGSLW